MRSEVADILQQMNVLLQRLADVLGDEGGSAGKPPLSSVDKGAGVLTGDERADRVYYAPPATYRVKDGVTLAIDGEKPHWITTNAAGAMILRNCSGQQTVGDVAHSLCQRYGVGPDLALADTLAFLESLEAAEYVTQSPRLAPAYRGRADTVGLGRLADVYLFVTNDCNLRCAHCYVSSGEYVPPREMTTDEILGLVDQARDLGADRFLITGGEPFMVRDIFTIIRHITAENDLVMLTNGMFFSEKYIAKLKESLGHGRISFQISIDGPTAELHDAIRGKGSFAKTIPAIQRVIGHGFDVAISTG
jgi:sulfatase maturation enzyme AslB (radical SAM superfamily)